MARDRVDVLVSFEPELLAELDRFWPAVGYPSRRAAIRAAVEQAIAAHRASVARERRVVAEPARWQPGPAWSPDDAAAEASRPLTADLADL